MYHKSQEPPLRQQERLWDISEDIHQFNKNIVSSSDSHCKRTKVRWLLFLYQKGDDLMATAKQLPSGTWRCLVFSHYEQILENGKPIIDSKTGKPKTKRIYESFTSDLPGKKGKRDAELQANAFLQEKHRKKRPEDMTVREACEEYIKLKENVLSESTLRGYETMLRNNMVEISDISLRNISQADVQRWINIISTRLSPKTVRNVYGFFVPVMSMFAPDIHFNTTLPEYVEKELYTPSDSDIKKLIRFVEGTELEKAVLLAAFGSLRRGEVCALRKEDISGNTIRVYKNIVRGRKGMIEKTPKNPQSCRYVEMPEFVTRKFDDVEGKLVKMHPEDISKNFNKVLASAGVPRFRFHDLRHYTASIMHAIGIPDQYIMKRGGWKSDRILKKVYRNVITEEDEKFTKKINSHFENMQI